MNIEYSVQESDLVALANYQVRQSPLVPQRVRRKRIAYALSFGLVSVGTYLSFPDTPFPIAFALLALLSLLLYAPLARRQLQATIPRLVRARMTASSLGWRRLRALPDGLEQESPTAQSKVIWSVVGPLERTATHAFVSIDGVYSVVIPVERVTMGDLTSFGETMAQFTKAAA